MVEMAPTIREASRADLPEILALYAQPLYDNGKVLDLPAAERIFDSLASYPFYRFFVAQTSDAIVGVYALLVMENLGHMGARSAVVEGVAVSPAVQGAGVGKQMMAHALRTARESGCYKLALSSNLKRTAAHGFYEKLGFRQHGVSFEVAVNGEARHDPAR